MHKVMLTFKYKINPHPILSFHWTCSVALLWLMAGDFTTPCNPPRI